MLTIVNMPFSCVCQCECALAFKVYTRMLSSYDRYARLINLTAQSIDRDARSIDCTVHSILIKHYNLESKIQDLLPIQGIILACLAPGSTSYPRYNFSLFSS